MTCSILITNVTGEQLPAVPGSCKTRVTVNGTATDCDLVTLTVRCPCGNTICTQTVTVNLNGVVTGNSAESGYFVNGEWELVMTLDCCCGGNIYLSAHCPGVNCSTSWTGTLNCPTCCPVTSTTVSIGNCADDDTVQVTFTTSVSLPHDCPDAVVHIDFGNGPPGWPHTVANGSSFTETHTYPAGNYTAQVIVDTPTNCPPEQVPLQITCPDTEPVDCCPQIETSVGYGACDADGNAAVTIEVTVTPAPYPNCPPAEVQIDWGNGDLGQAHSFAAAGSFSETRVLPEGPHSATIVVNAPHGCDSEQVSIMVMCPPCCPSVTITPCIQDCLLNGHHTVGFQVTVTPPAAPCPPEAITFYLDYGDGRQEDQVILPAGATSYSVSELHTYTGAAALQDNTVSIVVTSPDECAGTYGALVIDKCCPTPRLWLCGILFLVMSVSFTLLLLFLLFWGGNLASATCDVSCMWFTAPAVTLQYVVLGFAISSVVLLILYLILCYRCSCGWLLKLLWRMFFGAGLLYAILAQCAYGWVSLVIGLILMVLGIIMLIIWYNQCCVTLCRLLTEMMQWIAGVVIVFITQWVGDQGLAQGCLFGFPSGNQPVSGSGIPHFSVFMLAGILAALLVLLMPPLCIIFPDQEDEDDD